jgi:Sulfotransferase domain
MRLPDFVLIGAMKSGTTTLHEQLSLQPGIFMSEPKEPNFFSNDEVYVKGLEWYQSLFTVASPGDLCGESSTHYTKLPTYPLTVERMKAVLPRAKLIYMMRHPIDRLISHYMHEQFELRMRVPIDKAIDRHPELISYGCYSQQLQPFLRAYGPENILPIFFEHFVRHGQEELERVCHFIGYQNQPRWIEIDDFRKNTSNLRLRKSPVRDALVETPVLRALRIKLIPKSWRERIKRFWQMTERPTLSESSIQRLDRVFEQDMDKLGQALGIELPYSRYREIAVATAPV